MHECSASTVNPQKRSMCLQERNEEGGAELPGGAVWWVGSSDPPPQLLVLHVSEDTSQLPVSLGSPISLSPAELDTQTT